MVASTVFNGILMLAYAIVVLYCVGDYEIVSKSGMPILEVYFQATKSKTAATIMMLGQWSITIISLFNIVASVSRLTWAFARDNGLPFSKFFSYVSKTPSNFSTLSSVSSSMLFSHHFCYSEHIFLRGRHNQC